MLQRYAPISLVLALLLALPAAFDALDAAPARAAGPCASDAAVDSEEAGFLSLINAYRAQAGLSALSLSGNLTRSAAWMANDLGVANYFDHTDSLGRDPSGRARDCGYPGGAGENIAAGTVSSTAQDAFTMWRNSAAHNANMLNASYRQIGIARAWVAGSRYGWYWVTDFGLVIDSSTAVTTAAPAWVNDRAYGSPGGGFYWDFASGLVWTSERGWHRFDPRPARTSAPLWVNYPALGNPAGGFYLDPVSGEIWTAERGWHAFGG